MHKKTQYDEAYQYLGEALIFDNSSAMTKNNIIHYYNAIGTAYLRKKDFPNAIQIYKKGLMDIGENANVLEKILKFLIIIMPLANIIQEDIITLIRYRKKL